MGGISKKVPTVPLTHCLAIDVVSSVGAYMECLMSEDVLCGFCAPATSLISMISLVMLPFVSVATVEDLHDLRQSGR